MRRCARALLATIVLLVPGVVASSVVGVQAAAAAAPAVPSGTPYWPGWDIARAVSVTPDGHAGFVLDGFGGLHGFGIGASKPAVPAGVSYWKGWDIARGLALRNASSGWVLDAFGGIHPFGGAPAVNPATPPSYHPGADTARGIALNSSGTGLYVVDRAGTIQRLGLGGSGRPPAMALGSVGLNPPIGADVAVLSDGSGGIVLDGWGGLQHLGVPSVVPRGTLPYWQGWDIARGIAFLPDRSGGFVLDGYGGMHPIALGSGAPQLNTTAFMTGLSNPWDLAFAPDGHLVYTERPNGISVANADGSGRHLLQHPSDLLVASEAGMMGLALDPAFAANRRLYVCFGTHAAGRSDDVRLARFTVNADWSGLANRTDLLTGLPINPNGQLGRHSGCRPRFGPDGYLWVGTGDSAVGTVPQDLHSLGGKVLRIDTNGVAAPDNPVYSATGDRRIFSYGHRNVQGLAFAPGNPSWHGISIEHGTDRDDEANRLVTGNFGWDPIPGYNEATPMTDLVKFPAAVQAVWSSGYPTIAPSGAIFLTGAQWRTWEGALAVGVLKDMHLRIFFVRSDGSIRATTSQLSLGIRLRTPVEGPDGNLYITTDARPGGDQILRVVPT